ncbi:MAG: DUF1729 domain-containing protein, partial [Leptospiraceae bacterium]|nr:DUF1729 domain-containing protein [Leptospiraceae bacterium]
MEWAGGGQVTEAIFMERLDRLCEALEPGDSIVVNLLYLDAYLWGFQYPLVRRLSREGYPIDGITISAGIPDLDEAVSILDSLEQSGLWLNSFKPGTSSQIRQVLDIAAKRPGHSLIMQVEGGAAGGHHSWEHLEELVAANYHRIRRNDDVILAVGGGIATPRQAAEWLHGSWNSRESMPVDAVFLGTRLMAAAEAHTADTVKEALVRIGGQSTWSDGKSGANLGGIVSGRSGLGADIYYAKNHWSDTSAWLEKLLAGKDAASAREVIQANRTEIIDAINRTAKPYFGELDIDYATMLRRFVELTCASHLKNTDLNCGDAFIDQSYAARFEELAQRCIQRFGLTHPESDPDDPLSLIQSLIDQNSLVESTPLYPEDRQHFLQVCMRPGKPVNFIPVIDESLLRHYRSDSLWYSHCEGIDPESCAWIPGPVAVSGITIPNESVVQILSSFESAIIARSSTSSHSLAQAEYQRHSDYRAQVELDSTDHSTVRGNGDSPDPFDY